MFVRTFSRPAVRHAHHDFRHAGTCRRVEQECEHRDQTLGPLEREALVPDVLRVQEALEGFSGVEPVEQPQLLFARKRTVDPFDTLLDPALLVGFLDVHELDADRPAICGAQDVEDLAQASKRCLPPKPSV